MCHGQKTAKIKANDRLHGLKAEVIASQAWRMGKNVREKGERIGG
jgi:hypothetical protein